MTATTDPDDLVWEQLKHALENTGLTCDLCGRKAYHLAGRTGWMACQDCWNRAWTTYRQCGAVEFRRVGKDTAPELPQSKGSKR